jgi:diketogulonate reductase-like aldo/keto reductase
MQQKSLSNTGVSIPEVGLGTWNYHAGVEPLRKGLDAGALFIDTAESYGTEPVVGQAVAGVRNRVFIATKVSPEHFRFDSVLKAADGSLKRLSTDWIDLYQLHMPNDKVPIEETIAAMEQLVDAGKVRFIGVSNFSVAQLQRARNAARKYRIVSNQVRYNVVDRTIEADLLKYCQANGITIIAYSPLARDFQSLLDCDPDGALAEVARMTGKTIAQVAINWCLCKDDVVAIPKASSTAHVLENCAAAGWRLTVEQMQFLDRSIRWRRRGRMETFFRSALPPPMKRACGELVQMLPRGLRRCFK